VRLAKAEDKMTSAKLMHASGMSIRTIAEKLAVGKSSVARWIAAEK
jgi:transposase